MRSALRTDLELLTFRIVAGSAGFVGSTVQDVSETTPARPKSYETTPGKPQKPYFDEVGMLKNVTAVVGQPALLNCRVKHPGDRRVRSVYYYITY